MVLTFYAFSVWFMGIIADNTESFNHGYPSFVLHDFLSLWDRAMLPQQLQTKEKSLQLPLRHIHSDRWVSPGVLASPDGPASGCLNLFSPWTNPWQTGGGVKGLLILCSFLRLIIHSSTSSCYRCPVLRPCSSRKDLKTLLMVICPEESTLDIFKQPTSSFLLR